MWSDVVGLALFVSLNPMLLALILLMISRPRPIPNLVAFWIGCLIVNIPVWLVPLMLPAVGSGLVLTFARALGEFGATITFAGSLQGTTRTLPLAVYTTAQSDVDAAVAMSLLLVAVALAVIVVARPRAVEGQL